MQNTTTPDLVLVTLLAVFVLGVLALFVFWQLAKHRLASAPTTPTRVPARGGQALVGLATVTSAVVAVATYLGG